MSGTYISKIPVLVVALVIGIVLVTSAVVPLASDYSEAKTFTNEGYFRMTELTEDTDVTISWDGSKPTTFNINGVDVVVNAPINKTYSIVGSDAMIIRYVTAGGDNNRIQAYSSAGFIQSSTPPTGIMTITISGFTITVDNGTTTKTMTATQGYYIDPNGTSIMKDADKPAYVLKDTSIMILAGITNISGSGDTGVYAEGTIEDGLNFTYVPTSAATPTVTFGDVTFNYSEVAGYIDLVSLNNCTFDITNGSNTGNANYSYFIVPYEVSADPDNPVAYKNLVKVVPLMAFIMLVVAAAGMVYLKNKD